MEEGVGMEDGMHGVGTGLVVDESSKDRVPYHTLLHGLGARGKVEDMEGVLQVIKSVLSCEFMTTL